MHPACTLRTTRLGGVLLSCNLRLNRCFGLAATGIFHVAGVRQKWVLHLKQPAPSIEGVTASIERVTPSIEGVAA